MPDSVNPKQQLKCYVPALLSPQNIQCQFLLQPRLRVKRLLQRQDGGVLTCPWSLLIGSAGLEGRSGTSFLGSVTMVSFLHSH